MEIALIVGFSLILVLCVGASVLAYSNYIYSRNRVFSKTKYSVLWIILSSFMTVFMLTAGILFVINNQMPYANIYIALSFTDFVLCACYVIYFVLLPKLTNVNKISYDQILKIDYQEKINQIIQKVGDLEQFKNQTTSKHSKYCQNLLSYYESILKRVKNPKISLVEKMADIVTFNDAFTHKWSTFTNYYQTYLTFKFCEVLKKIS